MRLSELKIVFLYVLFGCLWILFSDQIIYLIFSNPEYLTIAQSVKGWVYVAVTGILLYLLISSYSQEIRNLYKKEQKERKEKETILTSTHDGIIAIKNDGEVFYLNTRAKELLGFQSIESSHPVKFWKLFPSDAQHIIEKVFKDIENSVSKEFLYITQLEINKNSDNPKWLEIKLNRGFFQHDNITICTVRDITENIRHYRDVELLKKALDQVGIALAIVETSGRILLGNNTLFTWGGKDLSQFKYLPELLGEIFSELGKRKDEILKVLQNRENFLVTIESKDGELRPHYYSLAIYPVELGGNLFAIVILSDITTQILSEKRLLQKQRIESIGFLASGIAHDFNNVLGSILANLELLIDEYSDYPSLVNSLDNIRNAVFRGREMTSQILSIGKESKGEHTLVNIEKIIDEVVRLIRPKIFRSINIITDVEPSLPHLLTSPGQLHQILLNLCMNACTAMSEKGGTLHIKAEKLYADESLLARHPELVSGNYIRIIVSDTGPGILPEALEHIFEPFFTTQLKNGGTGLGLYIVRTIVTSLSGGISVYSEPGKGSKFCVYLPVYTEVEKVSPVYISPITREELEGKGEKILLVDDEPLLAKAIGKVLQKLGYEVSVINNPKIAMDSIEKETISNFDLLIIDNLMPEITGEELIAKVKEKNILVPIILTSGFITDEVIKKGEKLGVVGILEKPCSSETLGKLVRKVLTEFNKEKANDH
ncbi:MAG: ATP-binding protein [Candidatus Hydrogenedentes bacterium]|nr:ATP-binding protein [Candidatus Hydrogenedentota bacterium]